MSYCRSGRFYWGCLQISAWTDPLAINILGAFVIGIIAASALKNHSISPRTVLFLKVGICGGFTTFSSFALETGELLKSGNIGMGFLYAVLSVVAGILAVFAGEMIISCRS